jgi:hypothetical protein
MKAKSRKSNQEESELDQKNHGDIMLIYVINNFDMGMIKFNFNPKPRKTVPKKSQVSRT